jgi:galactose mutarotase-like enzyme
MLVLRLGGAARLGDQASGRSLTLTTDEPVLEVFTGNSFDGITEIVAERRSRVCGSRDRSAAAQESEQVGRVLKR